jgi:excisionase family DNA binding protein
MLTVRELAERLRVSSDLVYRMVGRRKISYYRIGGSIRFSEQHIAEYLESVECQPQATHAPRRTYSHLPEFSRHLPKSHGFRAD